MTSERSLSSVNNRVRESAATALKVAGNYVSYDGLKSCYDTFQPIFDQEDIDFLGFILGVIDAVCEAELSMYEQRQAFVEVIREADSLFLDLDSSKYRAKSLGEGHEMIHLWIGTNRVAIKRSITKGDRILFSVSPPLSESTEEEMAATLTRLYGTRVYTHRQAWESLSSQRRMPVASVWHPIKAAFIDIASIAVVFVIGFLGSLAAGKFLRWRDARKEASKIGNDLVRKESAYEENPSHTLDLLLEELFRLERHRFQNLDVQGKAKLLESKFSDLGQWLQETAAGGGQFRPPD